MDAELTSTTINAAERCFEFENMRGSYPTLASQHVECTSPHLRDMARLIQTYSALQTSTQNIAIKFSEEPVSGESAIDQIKTIRDRLKLNRSQLAKVLDVSRPQLNKWLEEKGFPQKTSSNKRIAILFGALSKIPEEDGIYFGKLANRYVDTSSSLLDVLSRKELDEKSILDAYSALSGDIAKLRGKQSLGSVSIHDILPPAV